MKSPNAALFFISLLTPVKTDPFFAASSWACCCGFACVTRTPLMSGTNVRTLVATEVLCAWKRDTTMIGHSASTLKDCIPRVRGRDVCWVSMLSSTALDAEGELGRGD